MQQIDIDVSQSSINEHFITLWIPFFVIVLCFISTMYNVPRVAEQKVGDTEDMDLDEEYKPVI